MYNSTLTFLASLTKILVLFFASFIFWRKLKEDFPSEQIFGVTIVMCIFGALGAKLFSLEGAFLGIVGSLVLFSKFKKWNWWQAVDALVFPLLLDVFIFSFVGLSQELSWDNISQTLLPIIILFASLKIEKNYRSVSWYKSGKIGFLACFSVAAFFGPFLLLEILTRKTLYWQMLADLGIVISALILLYLRSERDFNQDKQKLLKIFKKNG